MIRKFKKIGVEFDFTNIYKRRATLRRFLKSKTAETSVGTDKFKVKYKNEEL
jgi:glutaredoxin-related protein